MQIFPVSYSPATHSLPHHTASVRMVRLLTLTNILITQSPWFTSEFTLDISQV